VAQAIFQILLARISMNVEFALVHQNHAPIMPRVEILLGLIFANVRRVTEEILGPRLPVTIAQVVSTWTNALRAHIRVTQHRNVSILMGASTVFVHILQ
jgi:hypothetical protein